MADFTSISSVGVSLERLLTQCFTESPPISDATTTVVLARTEDFDKAFVTAKIPPPALSLYLYRVDFNKATRAAWSAVGAQTGRAHLPLDLHYLITPWAANAEHEHRILGRALECLEVTPILSGPLLRPGPGWEPNEAVQLVLEELSTEAVMRTFDSLPTEYKLSVPYMARVVRLDSRQVRPWPEVATAVTGVKPEVAP